MDTKCKAQDAIRCELCDTHAPHMHCEICHINVCKVCMIDHLSDESKDHKLVTFNKRDLPFTTPFVKNMLTRYVNFIVNNVTFQCVYFVFSPETTNNT